MEALLFYILGAVTLASAFLVVLLRKPLHNVLFMILTMIGLAGIFILLHAEFVAMVQLIVYAGAIMVLFLFVIMLLNLERVKTAGIEGRSMRWWGGATIACAIMALVWLVFRVGPLPGLRAADQTDNMSNTAMLARELFTTYLLPFEVASVLLLSAIIGAVLLVRRKS